MKDSYKSKSSVKKKEDGKMCPSEQWQINVNLLPEGNDSPAGAFLPRRPKDRPTPHKKINECDH